MKKPSLFQQRRIFPYADFLLQVNRFTWAHLTDAELSIKIEACDKAHYPMLYSLIREVIFRCTGLSLFDAQLCTAYSMQQKHIAELPTGEGKTLAAVVTAACFALQGKHVHIFTFNDYLAKRDYEQSKDIFHFLNLTSDTVQESSGFSQRHKAYTGNIVYLTAKQAGFDYLKNFLCSNEKEFLDIPFDTVIVDEADSILIDAAVVPLILAGSTSLDSAEAIRIDNAVQSLQAHHVTCNKLQKEAWLTDSGISYMEQALQISGLYDAENTDKLAFISAAIEARYLLVKDKDYLVKGGQIFIIDQSTGRVVLARKFPALIHQAVEIKEGLANHHQTVIYDSIPLQFFLLNYESLCGMTGTAATSKKEIQGMYDLTVDVISPHIPCIRKDHSDCICATEKEKEKEVLLQIRRSYSKGQPVLVGTQSVMESEHYSKLLDENCLPHAVLNARNDDEEAEIISNAGRPYAITVSTNMAGRGVDIKLGGHDESEKEFVKAVGGLFIIGCGINPSQRLDRQLIGRAGRQGDPGESRFYISEEEPLLAEAFCKGQLKSVKLQRQIRAVQRSEEGKGAEARYMLGKYAYILELQRRRISSYRNSVLHSTTSGGIAEAEKQLILHFTNQHWADYLCTMENIRNGIHLSIIGGLDPIDEYNKLAVSAFLEMEEDIRSDVLSHIQTCRITSFGIDMKEFGLIGPSSTCTYMIDESKSQFAKLPHLLSHMSNNMRGTLFSPRDE